MRSIEKLVAGIHSALSDDINITVEAKSTLVQKFSELYYERQTQALQTLYTGTPVAETLESMEMQ